MQSKFENDLAEMLRRKNDYHEPIPGHEERFEMRLLQMKEKRKESRIPGAMLLAAAAACIAGIIISIVVIEVRKTNDQADKVRLSDVSSEMAAVESYYNERLQFDANGMNTEDRNIKRFMSDIQKLEEEYKTLEKNLARNFNNERIAQAMVSNYKFRLQLMEQLQKYIEIQNQINNQNNEQKLSS